MFRSLLVPLDGSAFSEHAIPFALSIASHALAWAFGGFLWIAVIVLIVMAFAHRTRRIH